MPSYLWTQIGAQQMAKSILIDFSLLKFVFSKNPTKIASPSIWHLLGNVKSTVNNLSIFVDFLENLNFKRIVELKTFGFVLKVS